MGKKKGSFKVGTSGWQYEHWKGVFYPSDLKKSKWFAHYAEHFDTVEVNNTFYHLPKPSTFDKWYRIAPEGFTYALKFSRYGTHLKKLQNPADIIGMFIQHAERLGNHLGPILVQLPPNWHADAGRLDAFLDEAPLQIRWAVEFRNEEWLCEKLFDILRKHNTALCIHDLIKDHPKVVTADWVYLRFHGAGGGGDYSHQALKAAAMWIKSYLQEGLDVYAYFNNDAQGYALRNAKDLRRFVQGK